MKFWLLLCVRHDLLRMRYFERNTVGDVLSRITNDVDTMSSGMAQSATQLVTNVTLLIGVLVMMLRISWLMTLIALIVLPVTGAGKPEQAGAGSHVLARRRH